MYGPVQGIKVCAVRFVFVTCLSLDLVFSFTALVDFVITHILNSVLWCVFGWLRCSAKIFPHPVSEKLASLIMLQDDDKNTLMCEVRVILLTT